jgi:DHA1 family inner membrane transport protein
MPLAILALAVGAFGIGTTEFVVMGLLPQISAGHRVRPWAWSRVRR